MNRRRAKWPCWKLLTATTSQTLKLPKKLPCQVPKKFASMSTWILRTIQWREQCGAMDHHIPKWKDSWSYEWSFPTNVTNMIVREEMAGDFPRSISLPSTWEGDGWGWRDLPERLRRVLPGCWTCLGEFSRSGIDNLHVFLLWYFGDALPLLTIDLFYFVTEGLSVETFAWKHVGDQTIPSNNYCQVVV